MTTKNNTRGTLCTYGSSNQEDGSKYKMDTRRNAPEEPDKVETIPNCITTKESSGFNVYAAMNGYDHGMANPMDSKGDPGVRSRIFLHDCVNRKEELVNSIGETVVNIENGYYSFIGDIRKEMACDSEFSSTTISTETAYQAEHSSSNEFSQSASASVGMLYKTTIFRFYLIILPKNVI